MGGTLSTEELARISAHPTLKIAHEMSGNLLASFSADCRGESWARSHDPTIVTRWRYTFSVKARFWPPLRIECTHSPLISMFRPVAWPYLLTTFL